MDLAREPALSCDAEFIVDPAPSFSILDADNVTYDQSMYHPWELQFPAGVLSAKHGNASGSAAFVHDGSWTNTAGVSSSSSSSSPITFEGHGEDYCYSAMAPGQASGSPTSNFFSFEVGNGMDATPSPLTKRSRADAPSQHRAKQEAAAVAKKQCCGKRSATKRSMKPIVTQPRESQTAAAKNRRERVNERLKVLQELVPNGRKVDTVTMLDKAITYVKFMQLQLKVLETDAFWPTQEGKAPEMSQVKEALNAILLNTSSSSSSLCNRQWI